jgi:hypothetical protein
MQDNQQVRVKITDWLNGSESAIFEQGADPMVKSLLTALAQARAHFHDRNAKLQATRMNIAEAKAALAAVKSGENVDLDAEINALGALLTKLNEPWVR